MRGRGLAGACRTSGLHSRAARQVNYAPVAFSAFLPQPATHPRGRAPRPNARAAKIRQPSCESQRSSGFGAELRSQRERETELSTRSATPRHSTQSAGTRRPRWGALEQRVPTHPRPRLPPAACSVFSLLPPAAAVSRLSPLDLKSPGSARSHPRSGAGSGPFFCTSRQGRRATAGRVAVVRISIHRLTILSPRGVGHQSASHVHHLITITATATVYSSTPPLTAYRRELARDQRGLLGSNRIAPFLLRFSSRLYAHTSPSSSLP